MVKNKDVVKKEINSHFELTISFLTSCKEKLLKSVDVKTSDDLNLLNYQVNDLQTYIQNMVEYKANKMKIYKKDYYSSYTAFVLLMISYQKSVHRL